MLRESLTHDFAQIVFVQQLKRPGTVAQRLVIWMSGDPNNTRTREFTKVGFTKLRIREGDKDTPQISCRPPNKLKPMCLYCPTCWLTVHGIKSPEGFSPRDKPRITTSRLIFPSRHTWMTQRISGTRPELGSYGARRQNIWWAGASESSCRSFGEFL